MEEVLSELEELDFTRETVIRLSRSLNRAAGKGIAALVKKKPYDINLSKCREIYTEIVPHLQKLAPTTSWNIALSGVEEYAEFELLHSILTKGPFKSPSELMIPSWIWITALGDVIGELRRLMLHQLIEGNMEESHFFLDKSERIYEELVGLDFSKNLVPNLRRKIDVARSIIERSQSDFASGILHKRTKDAEN